MIFSSIRHQAAHRSRTFALSVALWLFGIATSIVLIGLWGRSVAGDQVTLEASTRAVLESELVNDRVADWLGDAVAVASQASTDDVAAVVAAVEDSPQMQSAIDDVVDQAVTAALAPPGTVTQVDLSRAIDSLVQLAAAALENRGLLSDTDAIRAAANDIPGILLSAEDQMIVGGTAREVRGLLSKVVVVGLGGMLLFGAAAIMLNRDRVHQLRSLVIRIGVSAITFAIVIRIGGWAVDPAGGRSPFAAGGAVLLKSNGHILATVALGAAVVAGGLSAVRLRRRRLELTRLGPVVGDDSTGEQPVLVGVGMG